MGKNSRQISVVIPAYNEEHYLPHCLQSLKQQTVAPLEIIVVDNNSTDKTAEIAREHGARVVLETKQGMTFARQRGFAEARTELIARTDADSKVASDWLEYILKTFDEHPEYIALTGVITSPNPKKAPEFIFSAYSFMYHYIGLILTGHTVLLGPNMTIRKSVWEKVSIHTDDSLVHEDGDLSCHVAGHGPIGFNPAIKVTWSLRKVKKNAWHGFKNYCLEYPQRYFRTILIHHHWFRRKHTSDT